MRMLTDEERQVLFARASDAPRVADYTGGLDHVCNRLVADGRIVERLTKDEEGVFLYAHITDLGRLALRVGAAARAAGGG